MLSVEQSASDSQTAMTVLDAVGKGMVTSLILGAYPFLPRETKRLMASSDLPSRNATQLKDRWN